MKSKSASDNHAPQNSHRRKFLIQAPLAAAGLLVCMEGKAQASTLLTGNYRRRIESDNCTACGACAEVCPTSAIRESSGIFTINPNLCFGCGACEPTCPTDAVKLGTLIIVPSVDAEECLGCSACASSCPTGAISIGEVAVIDRSRCSGCRDCVPVCPVAAIS